MRGIFFCILFMAAIAPVASYTQSTVTPVAYNTAGSLYTQNFDGLPAGGSFALSGKGPFNLSAVPVSASNLNGWQIMLAAGTNTNAVFAVSTGSSTGNGVYSLGGSGSTDRALGSLSSSAGIYSMGMVFTNNTGSILNSFTVNFTAEQWRKGGSGNKNTWAFRYKTGIITQIDPTDLVDEQNLNFSSVINTISAAALDGNQSANQQIVSYTVHGISWKAGEQLLLRWDDADESGSDDAAGIDNFSFSAALTTGIPSVSGESISSITDHSAILTGTVNDHYAITSIVFEYDTLNAFLTPFVIHPIPDTLQPGAGNTNVSANISALLSAKNYYARIKANNSNGSVTGTIQNFTTAISLPTVTTTIPSGITTSTAILGGAISATGGGVITEKGIVWSTATDPVIANNKISISNGTTDFSQLVTGLLQGSVLFARAYAINAGGVAYGNNVQFSTQTMITSLNANTSNRINAAAVNFNFKTAQNISGLSAGNFYLVTNIPSAVITAVTGSLNSFTITASTGTGDGTIGLSLINDVDLSVPVNNKPFTSTGYYTIDKTLPQVNAVAIPNSPMKIGDTIPVTISVRPDTDIYKTASANIDGFNLSGLTKKNDSTYTAFFIIINGGTDISAAADIPVNLILTDSAGNSNLPFTLPVSQSLDLIDANKPFITSIQNPLNKTYVSGDTLNFIFRFSEKITVVSGVPSVTVTVGTKSKTAVYINGSGTDSLWFRYIVSGGDLDTDGIKTAGTITLNNSSIKDLAGNTATVSFNNSSATKDILVDGMIPVISSITAPDAAVYKTGNILDFIVTYTRKVFVTASDNPPSITIGIGSKLKNAVYINGSGSTVLLFRYMIQSDDVDTDGIKLISPLNDINALIRDSVGNRSSLILNNIGATTSIYINPPTIHINSVTVPDDGMYKSGDTLLFLVSYNEKIFVTTAAGIPSIKITVGTSSKQAIYTGGSGGNTLVFMYIVQPGDADIDGIKINSSISLNNGLIKDAQGSIAPIVLGTFITSGIVIDAVLPVINTVTVPATAVYKAGDTLSFFVNFSKPVTVLIKKDTPCLKLTIGSIQKNILYISGSGTTTLLFRYVVQPRDLDKNGISMEAAISLNNSLINDTSGNPATLSFKAVSLSNIKIDAVSPVFVSSQTETIQVCENSRTVLFSNLLSVADEESSEMLTWKIENVPVYGTVSWQSLSANANGKNVTPATNEYKPYKDQYGSDTLLVEVTDGVNVSQKRIVIVIQRLIQNNFIGSSQVICYDQPPAILSGLLPSGGDGFYKYVWEVSIDSAKFTDAAGFNGLQQYLPAQLNNPSWFRRRIISGSCTDTSLPVKITVLKNGLWLGKNSDWHNAANWCGGNVPASSTDVMIYPDALYAPLISDTARCNHLTIANDAHLIITGILEVNGNINGSNYSIQAEKGSIVCNGLTAQNINSRIFVNQSIRNLTINNNHSVVSLADHLQLTGTLLLHAGTLQTNDYLTLSNAATISASAGGTYITGNVSVEHMVKGGRRCFRLLGHPFMGSMGLQMIRDSLDITGDDGPANGFTATATNQPSAFRYDPFTGNDSAGIDAGWIPFTNTNGTGNNAWQRYSGIRLLMRGRPGQGLDGTPAGDGTNGTYLPGSVTIKVSGMINTGDQEVPLAKNVYAGYNVIANPYVSNIDLSRITRGSDVGSSYWLWNAQQGRHGGYTSYPARDKNMLPPFGAFIAKASGMINNRLLFTENCKSAEIYSDTITSPTLDDIFFIELRLESDSIFYDRIILLQMDSARTGTDKNDAEKFWNSDVNFYSLSRENKMLSIDARPLTNESVIPLGIQTTEPGTFKLHITKANLSVTDLMLHDKYLDKWIPLEKDNSYLFTTDADTSSSGNGRFEITAKQKPVDTFFYISRLITKINPVPANDRIMINYKAQEKGNTSIRILSLTGKVLKTIPLGLQKEGQVMVPIGNFIKGIYLVEVRCGNAISMQKMIKN